MGKNSTTLDSRIGPLEVSPDRTIFFPRGLIGFETLREFALVEFKPGSPFHFLQSLETAAMGMMLVLYCLAFLLPSALLTALAARGTAVNTLSRLLADRMPLVKWATAMLFAAVMLVMWL